MKKKDRYTHAHCENISGPVKSDNENSFLITLEMLQVFTHANKL